MKKMFLLICMVCLVLCANSQGIKLKITGVTPADGEEVIAFETSDTIPITPSTGSGSGAGLPVFEFVKIKKLSGLSSNELFRRSLLGTHTAEMSFEFTDLQGVLFYKIVLKDVLISHFSYLSPECQGCTKLFHQVWFDYRQIEVTDVATGIIIKYNRNTRAVS